MITETGIVVANVLIKLASMSVEKMLLFAEGHVERTFNKTNVGLMTYWDTILQSWIYFIHTLK